MSRRIMAVFSNPASPEQEEAFNAWYEVHLKEVLTLPGVVAATRYRLQDGAPGPAPEHRYLAVYEIDGSAEEILAGLGTLPGNATSAIDAAGVRLLFWEPVGDGSGS